MPQTQQQQDESGIVWDNPNPTKPATSKQDSPKQASPSEDGIVWDTPPADAVTATGEDAPSGVNADVWSKASPEQRLSLTRNAQPSQLEKDQKYNIFAQEGLHTPRQPGAATMPEELGHMGSEAWKGAKGLVGGTVGMAKDVSNTLMTPTPWTGSSGVPALYKKYIGDPAVAEGNKAKNVPAGPLSGLEKAGHYAAAALPIVGPWASSLGEQAGSGDVLGAASNAAGTMGAGELLPKVAKAVMPEMKAGTPAIPPTIGADGVVEHPGQPAGEPTLGAPPIVDAMRQGFNKKEPTTTLQDNQAKNRAAGNVFSQSLGTRDITIPADEVEKTNAAITNSFAEPSKGIRDEFNVNASSSRAVRDDAITQARIASQDRMSALDAEKAEAFKDLKPGTVERVMRLFDKLAPVIAGIGGALLGGYLGSKMEGSDFGKGLNTAAVGAGGAAAAKATAEGMVEWRQGTQKEGLSEEQSAIALRIANAQRLERIALNAKIKEINNTHADARDIDKTVLGSKEKDLDRRAALARGQQRPFGTKFNVQDPGLLFNDVFSDLRPHLDMTKPLTFRDVANATGRALSELADNHPNPNPLTNLAVTTKKSKLIQMQQLALENIQHGVTNPPANWLDKTIAAGKYVIPPAVGFGLGHAFGGGLGETLGSMGGIGVDLFHSRFGASSRNAFRDSPHELLTKSFNALNDRVSQSGVPKTFDTPGLFGRTKNAMSAGARELFSSKSKLPPQSGPSTPSAPPIVPPPSSPPPPTSPNSGVEATPNETNVPPIMTPETSTGVQPVTPTPEPRTKKNDEPPKPAGKVGWMRGAMNRVDAHLKDHTPINAMGRDFWESMGVKDITDDELHDLRSAAVNSKESEQAKNIAKIVKQIEARKEADKNK